jgi:hypothetical protein
MSDVSLAQDEPRIAVLEVEVIEPLFIRDS